MMEFFDIKRIQKEKANLPEAEGCNRQIAELEEKRKEIICRIGQIYVENATEETVAGTAYEEAYREFKLAEEEMEVLEKRKLAVQGLRKCEKCGNILVINSSFCNMCGEKLEALFVPTKDNPHICEKCGTPYDEDTLFCTVCGNKLA